MISFKKTLIIVSILLTASTLFSCTLNETNNYKPKNINTKSINDGDESINNDSLDLSSNSDSDISKSRSISSKLVNVYKTLDEINNDSEAVVTGTIVNNDEVDYDGLPFVISTFKVTNSIKGDIKIDDVIKVIQISNVLEEGNDAALLLQRYDGSIIENGYICTGDFQGRFILKNTDSSSSPLVILENTFLEEDITFKDFLNL